MGTDTAISAGTARFRSRVLLAATATTALDVGLGQVAITGPRRALASFSLMAITVVVGLWVVRASAGGSRRPIGGGILLGSALAVVVLLLLAAIRLSALGT